MKFKGTLDEYKSTLSGLGVVLEWKEDANKIECRPKGMSVVINWWPSSGTVQVQGKDKDRIEPSLVAAIEGKAPPSGDPAGKLKIFIVHGHDPVARDQLELVLHRLGLNPYILQNQDGGSLTIIEALEKRIYLDSAFGIVLLTPDDYGYAKAKTDADRQPRARQNAVLETGMLLASLGRDRMAIIKKGALELPSDLDGLIRLEFNDAVKDIVPKLVQRLQNAGIHIEPARIALAQS